MKLQRTSATLVNERRSLEPITYHAKDVRVQKPLVDVKERQSHPATGEERT